MYMNMNMCPCNLTYLYNPLSICICFSPFYTVIMIVIIYVLIFRMLVMIETVRIDWYFNWVWINLISLNFSLKTDGQVHVHVIYMRCTSSYLYQYCTIYIYLYQYYILYIYLSIVLYYISLYILHVVLYCTLLAKAETNEVKSSLEEEMLSDPNKAVILKVLMCWYCNTLGIEYVFVLCNTCISLYLSLLQALSKVEDQDLVQEERARKAAARKSKMETDLITEDANQQSKKKVSLSLSLSSL